MATYETRHHNGNRRNIFEETTAREVQEKEELARKLSTEAMRQWQKTFEGALAFPAALALGFAASAMYAVTFVTRGFEVFQTQAREMGQELGRMNEPRREAEPRREEPRRDFDQARPPFEGRPGEEPARA